MVSIEPFVIIVELVTLSTPLVLLTTLTLPFILSKCSYIGTLLNAGSSVYVIVILFIAPVYLRLVNSA